MVTQRVLRHPAVRTITVLALLLGSVLISRGSAAYFDDDWPEFVVEKLPLSLSADVAGFEALWLRALQAHVVAAAIALPGCVLLLSRTLLRRARALHRWLGRVVGVLVLFVLVPSGLVLALEAKGGAVVTAGFVLSALLVVVGMIGGIVAARRHHIVAHRRFVLHVLAQLAVAVASRVLLVAFDALSVDEHVAYVVSLWVPVIGNAVVVEVLTKQTTKHQEKRHEVLDARDRVVLAARLDGPRHAA